MTVKIEDIREGDEVLIAFRVARVDTSTAWPYVEVDKFNLDGGIVSDEYLSAGVYAIAQHIPRKIEVGDVCLDRDCRVVVVAIADGDAWVAPKSTDRPSSAIKHYTVRLDNLERVS